MSADAIEFHPIGGAFTSGLTKAAVKVTEVTGGPKGFSALLYQCPMNVDWDGAPFAYGLDNPADASVPLQVKGGNVVLGNLGDGRGMVWNSKKQEYEHDPQDHFQRNLKPIEHRGLGGSLRDATDNKKGKGLFIDHDFVWTGVKSVKPDDPDVKMYGLWLDQRDALKDKFGRFPVIQKDGSSKGYYLSTSGSAAISAAAQKANAGWQYQQSSYWDASKVPYCVWPSLLGHGVRLGDFGLVIRHRTGRSCGFFFADTGSTTKLGECSGYLVTRVAGSPLDNNDKVSFVVFPMSGSGSAQQGQDLQVRSAVMAQIAKLSGVPNAEELIAFLAMEANPDKKGSLLPLPGSRAAAYDNILRALKEWGFKTARQPINVR